MTNYYFSQCYSMQYFWMFIFNVFIYDLKDYVLRLLASVAVLKVEPARVPFLYCQMHDVSQSSAFSITRNALT